MPALRSVIRKNFQDKCKMDETEEYREPVDSNILSTVNEDKNDGITNLCKENVEGVSEVYKMEVDEDNLKNSIPITETTHIYYSHKIIQDSTSDASKVLSDTHSKEGECLEEHLKNMSFDSGQMNTEHSAAAVSRDDCVNSKVGYSTCNVNNDVVDDCVNNKVGDSVSSGTCNVNNDVMVSEDVVDCQNNLIQPLQYVFDNVRYITEAWTEFAYRKESECFLKGCKWSPDGTCLLSNSEDNILRLFELPLAMYNCRTFNDNLLNLNELTSVLRIKEGGLIYDYCWYPLMSSLDPDTCCLLSTSLGSPLHLWDAYTGKLLATYRAYDNVDEVMSARSVAFNFSGTQIYSGFKNTVKIFNTSAPGRNCDTINTKALAEQEGIVSCIAVNPDMEEVFAVGTFRRTIGLYTDYGDAVCILKGQSGGLTHLMFSPDGKLLYTGARKDNEILCWDLRNTADVLFALSREVTTNQRIYFDITQDGKYLISGSTDGVVRVWDVSSAKSVDDEQTLSPIKEWKAHNDCANGLSIHKQIPVVATSSGQRHVPEIIDNDDEDDKILIRKAGKEEKEDMIKLWWCGPNKNSESGMM